MRALVQSQNHLQQEDHPQLSSRAELMRSDTLLPPAELSREPTTTTRLVHDFSRIPVRMPEPRRQRKCACGGTCPRCQTEKRRRLQKKRVGSTEPDQTAAPPIVEEVLENGGRSLPDRLRTEMEQRFGHDFGRVRLHTGTRAAESAAAVGARAYTVGRDVAFAAGEYAPDTKAGQRLIAHELAHVVQQAAARAPAGRANIAITAAVDPLEREAETAARYATEEAEPGLVGASLSADVGRLARTPVLQRAAAPYDTTTFTLPPLKAGLTLADVTRALKKKQAAKPPDITSWSTVGVKPGSAEELYVLYAVWQLAEASRWGSEADIVTEIGPGKKGAVTVRIDAAGKAVGELVSAAAPTVTATYKTVADAIKGLKAKYGLAGLKGEKGKSWSSLDELNKVAAAWARLSPAEAAALSGYTLIRTDDTLASPSGDPASGLTTRRNATAPDGLSAIKTREIRFPDRAFADDVSSFVGDAATAAPASFIPLLHEVGHAQETKLVDDARALEIGSLVDTNKASVAANRAATKAVASLNAGIKAWNGFKAAAAQTASKPYLDALRAAFAAIEAFRAEPDPTKMAALDAPAQAAVTARDTAKAAVPAASPAHAAFASALRDQDAYLKAVQALLAKRQAQSTASAKVKALKDPTGVRSKRLQNFVDFVTTNNIPPVTEYAKKNWPANPEEFYAEAFSLWHNDPKFFAAYSPKLKTWFDTGEDLK